MLSEAELNAFCRADDPELLAMRSPEPAMARIALAEGRCARLAPVEKRLLDVEVKANEPVAADINALRGEVHELGFVIMQTIRDNLPALLAKHLGDRLRLIEQRLDDFEERAVDPAPIEARIYALQAEVEELRARKALQYRGVWKPEHMLKYSGGDAVTIDGSLFIATGIPSARPGSGPDTGWTLAVKRGRNG
jgi:hypothetical protein